MNCFDLALKTAFVKKFIVVLTTHYTETESENIKTVEFEKFTDLYSVKDFDVVMFSAEKKNTIKIWGYKEV